MYLQCYLRKGVVYIPTSGMIEQGFYRGIEPVAVIPLSSTDALRRAFAETIARGNPKVPSLKRSEHPPPVLPKYAGVKSWNTFARDAMVWAIDERNGIFKIVAYRKDPPGGWREDKDKHETFPSGATVAEVVERIIAILQQTDSTSSSNE